VGKVVLLQINKYLQHQTTLTCIM